MLTDYPTVRYRNGIPITTFPLATVPVGWLIGGAAFWFLLRSLGDPDPSAIPYLGGVTDVGAIVGGVLGGAGHLRRAIDAVGGFADVVGLVRHNIKRIQDWGTM